MTKRGRLVHLSDLNRRLLVRTTVIEVTVSPEKSVPSSGPTRDTDPRLEPVPKVVREPLICTRVRRWISG